MVCIRKNNYKKVTTTTTTTQKAKIKILSGPGYRNGDPWRRFLICYLSATRVRVRIHIVVTKLDLLLLNLFSYCEVHVKYDSLLIM